MTSSSKQDCRPNPTAPRNSHEPQVLMVTFVQFVYNRRRCLRGIVSLLTRNYGICEAKRSPPNQTQDGLIQLFKISLFANVILKEQKTQNQAKSSTRQMLAHSITNYEYFK